MASGMSAVRSMTPDFFAMTFGMAALMLGKHWELADDEATSLSKAGWTMVDTFPKADRKKLEKWVSQYVPRLMFTVMLVWVIGERTAESIRLAKLARAKQLNKPQSIGANNATSQTQDVQSRAGEQSAGEGESTGGTKQFLSDPVSEAFSRAA